jgi:hypothetical protein
VLLIVLAANVVVDLYVRAAMRDAIDEAARSTAPATTDAATCTVRARTAIASLVRGPIARGISLQCTVSPAWVRVDAQTHAPSFLPGLMPRWTITVHAVVQREPR